ncbi:MAG: FHA domain-containing protein [Chloroflexi bacterium]|nr:FHA domain-containing protein [Chloroflexota bacterium]
MKLAPGFIFVQALVLALAGTILLLSSYTSVRIVGAFLLVGGSIGLIVAKSVAHNIVQAVSETARVLTLTTLRLKKLAPGAFITPLAGVDASLKKQIPLYGTTHIGRDRRISEIVLHADEETSPISGLHCTILEEDGAFRIRDEESTNGTYLNDMLLTPETKQLIDGDVIELGQVARGGIRLQFSIPVPEDTSSH